MIQNTNSLVIEPFSPKVDFRPRESVRKNVCCKLWSVLNQLTCIVHRHHVFPDCSIKLQHVPLGGMVCCHCPAITVGHRLGRAWLSFFFASCNHLADLMTIIPSQHRTDLCPPHQSHGLLGRALPNLNWPRKCPRNNYTKLKSLLDGWKSESLKSWAAIYCSPFTGNQTRSCFRTAGDISQANWLKIKGPVGDSISHVPQLPNRTSPFLKWPKKH